eukprot:COSAG06_NODE_281_length_18447_cov_14.060116_5_plen_1627_part_00
MSATASAVASDLYLGAPSLRAHLASHICGALYDNLNIAPASERDRVGDLLITCRRSTPCLTTSSAWLAAARGERLAGFVDEMSPKNRQTAAVAAERQQNAALATGSAPVDGVSSPPPQTPGVGMDVEPDNSAGSDTSLRSPWSGNSPPPPIPSRVAKVPPPPARVATVTAEPRPPPPPPSAPAPPAEQPPRSDSDSGSGSDSDASHAEEDQIQRRMEAAALERQAAESALRTSKPRPPPSGPPPEPDSSDTGSESSGSDSEPEPQTEPDPDPIARRSPLSASSRNYDSSSSEDEAPAASPSSRSSTAAAGGQAARSSDDSSDEDDQVDHIHATGSEVGRVRTRGPAGRAASGAGPSDSIPTLGSAETGEQLEYGANAPDIAADRIAVIVAEDSEDDVKRARAAQKQRAEKMSAAHQRAQPLRSRASINGSPGKTPSPRRGGAAADSTDDSGSSSESDSLMSHRRPRSSPAERAPSLSTTAGSDDSESETESGNAAQRSTRAEVQAEADVMPRVQRLRAGRKVDKRQLQTLQRDEEHYTTIGEGRGNRDSLAAEEPWTREVPWSRRRAQAARKHNHRKRVEIEKTLEEAKEQKKKREKLTEQTDREIKERKRRAEREVAEMESAAEKKLRAAEAREREVEKEKEEFKQAEMRKTADLRAAAHREAAERVAIVDAQKDQLQQALDHLEAKLVEKDNLAKALQGKIDAEARSRRMQAGARRKEKTSNLSHLEQLNAVVKMQKLYRTKCARRVMKDTQSAGAKQVASLREKTRVLDAVVKIQRRYRERKARQVMKATQKAAASQVKMLRAQHQDDRRVEEELESLREQVEQAEELRELTPRLQRQLAKVEEDHSAELNRLGMDHHVAIKKLERQHQAAMKKMEAEHAEQLERAETEAEARGKQQEGLRRDKQERDAVKSAVRDAKEAVGDDHSVALTQLQKENQKENAKHMRKIRSLEEQVQQSKLEREQLMRDIDEAQAQAAQAQAQAQAAQAKTQVARAPRIPAKAAPPRPPTGEVAPPPAPAAPPAQEALNAVVAVEDIETTPERALYVIRFEASGGRMWRCTKGWSDVRTLSKKLGSIKGIDRAARWNGKELASKKTTPKTRAGVWDDKRLRGRKQEMQTFWDAFVEWVNNLDVDTGMDIFEAQQMQDFLSGSEVEVGQNRNLATQPEPEPEPESDPEPVTFKLPGDLNKLSTTEKDELKDSVRKNLPLGSVDRIQLEAGSIVVLVYFLALANVTDTKRFLQTKVAKGKLKVKFGGKSLTAVPKDAEVKEEVADAGGRLATAQSKEVSQASDDLERMQSFETGRGGDDAGAPYTVGAAVEIMSKSQGGWVAATVTTVDKTAEQITVQYKNAKGTDMQKTLMFASKDLRPAPGSLAPALTLSPQNAYDANAEEDDDDDDDDGEGTGLTLPGAGVDWGKSSRTETAGEPPSVPGGPGADLDPTALSGFWRAKGTLEEDGTESLEYLKLEVDSAGTITGYVDSNGDGIFNEDDCQLRNGSFDLDDGEFRFEQVFLPSEEYPDGETTSWSALYDPKKDRLIKGEWRDENDKLTGTFVAKRDDKAQLKKQQAERRLDLTDGQVYTKEQFVEQYGGEDEWNASEPPTPVTEEAPPASSEKKKKKKKKKKKAK